MGGERVGERIGECAFGEFVWCSFGKGESGEACGRGAGVKFEGGDGEISDWKVGW